MIFPICQRNAYTPSEIIFLDELSPLQVRFILILSPIADLSILDFDNYYPVIPVIHLEGILSTPGLRLLVKCKMAPGHPHRRVWLIAPSEELIQRFPPGVDLFIRRFGVKRVFGVTIGGLLSVPFVPAGGDRPHQALEFSDRDFIVRAAGIHIHADNRRKDYYNYQRQ